MDAKATELIELQPRWDHIANKKDYFPTLARKLLEAPQRPQLADKLSSVGRLSDIASDFWMAIADALRLPDADRDLECLAVASALSSASQTMCIMAACNCVEDFKSTARGRDMAASILKRSASSIPDPLRRLLEKEASG